MTQVSTLRVLRNTAWFSPLLCRTMVATFLFSGSLHGQSRPQPVPLPAATEPPQDKPYPGTITLHVDATDVLRRIYNIYETIPVSHAGAFTLLFPQWAPGDHAPNEPLEKLAGLVMTAKGKRLYWTPNLNSPEQDSMLWVFEGLTSYLEDVLCARAGIFTHDDIEQIYAGLAGAMTLDAGADWRPLQDTNKDPLVSVCQPLSWATWQRNMFDPYSMGEMIWLEVDATIRQESGGKRSLDDFARSFFSGDDAGDATSTYTFYDLVAGLSKVQSYDWRGFLRTRLDDYGQGHLVHSIDKTGYRLIFTDKPIGDAPLGKSLGLTYSLGMRIDAAGRITTVQWQGPAFKAYLSPGETIVQVNGQPYAPELLVKAIREATGAGKLELLVKRGEWQQTAHLDWHGGMQFPHLQRIDGKPNLLDEILAPRK